MTTYYSHGVSLSNGQRQRLAKAYNNNAAITLRLSSNELTGPDQLMLTRTQINKIQKAMSQGTGVDVKINKSQIRKAVQHGGPLWSSLISLGTKVLPYAIKGVSKVAPALASGALSTLGSLVIDKIFGKGQTSGFLIQTESIVKLLPYTYLLNEAQKKSSNFNANW